MFGSHVIHFMFDAVPQLRKRVIRHTSSEPSYSALDAILRATVGFIPAYCTIRPLKVGRRFGGTYDLHHQGRISRARQRESRWLAVLIGRMSLERSVLDRRQVWLRLALHRGHVESHDFV
jgi:hypothetical protein